MHPKLLLDDDDDYDYDNVDKDNDNDNDKLIADTIWAKLVTFSIFIFSHCHLSSSRLSQEMSNDIYSTSQTATWK